MNYEEADPYIIQSLGRLEDALKLVALPAHEQFQIMPQEVDIPFEIADDFCNWCRWALSREELPLTAQQLQAIKRVYNAFNEISGPCNSHLWTDEAVRFSTEWERIRQLARECLSLLLPD